jgi:hypothetical protein
MVRIRIYKKNIGQSFFSLYLGHLGLEKKVRQKSAIFLVGGGSS